jgi:hypothetical protein
MRSRDKWNRAMRHRNTVAAFFSRTSLPVAVSQCVLPASFVRQRHYALTVRTLETIAKIFFGIFAATTQRLTAITLQASLLLTMVGAQGLEPAVTRSFCC